MLYLNAEMFTMDEVATGHIDNPSDPAKPQTLDQVIKAQRNMAADFSVEIGAKPRFQAGDTVTTKRIMPASHTRLPGYARCATGTVTRHHGAHLLADKGATGEHVGEHLYTVSFTARELWGDDANPLDTVTLELWESYFV